MHVSTGQQKNHLIMALPPDVQRSFSDSWELELLNFGKVLREEGEHFNNVYFHFSAIVSLHCVISKSHTSEVAVVGNEGMVGMSLYMGTSSQVRRCVVHRAGYAYRLKGEHLQEAFRYSLPLRQVLLRYAQARVTQMAQTAFCNRHCQVEQQLCRWLLFMLDRSGTNVLVMTEELIANMLGVQRYGITDAATTLHDAGLLDYSRGHITIHNRRGLEERVCDCYRIVDQEYNRLFSDTIAG